jgi:hypothetical protein
MAFIFCKYFQHVFLLRAASVWKITLVAKMLVRMIFYAVGPGTASRPPILTYRPVCLKELSAEMDPAESGTN